MKPEARLIIEIWDTLREHVASSKRTEVAYGLVRAFEEYGMDAQEVAEIADEDKHLAQAYIDIYDIEIEDDDIEDDE